MPNEHTSLIPPALPKKGHPLLQTVAFGLNSVAVAVYIVSNSKLISILNPSAAAVVGPYQSVILASGLGLTLSTGLELGAPVAAGRYYEAGDIEKAGVVTSVGVGALVVATMLSMNGILPLIFEAQVAEVAAEFFQGASIGAIPLIITITDTQLAYQEGHWYIPPLSGAALLTVSIPSAYALGFLANKGAFGVGLGSSIAPIVVCFGMRLWFLTEPYAKYNLHDYPDFSTFPAKIKKLVIEGTKLSIQRLTEWLNLSIITDVIAKGPAGNSALAAVNPLFEYFRIFGAGFQGMGQGTGMLVKYNKERMRIASLEGRHDEALELHRKVKDNILYSNLAGLAISVAIDIPFYFFRKPLTQFFLDNNSSQTQEDAQTFFWIGMLGIIPDSIRLIMVGSLRGWKDLTYPMLVSAITMIGIGTPLGWGISKAVAATNTETSEAAFMLYLRDAMVVIAAILLSVRCAKHLWADAPEAAQEHGVQEDAVPVDPVPQAEDRIIVSENRYATFSSDTVRLANTGATSLSRRDSDTDKSVKNEVFRT